MNSRQNRHDRNQIIITTHANADFDAVASMLAAQKLYPGAMVVFPGSQEKKLREFFIKSMAYLFNVADIKDIDPDEVSHLVLVDTRQKSRISQVAHILQQKHINIHIYDHHPASDSDITGDIEEIEQTGATITILTEILKKKDIDISPDEATMMALGLYEDTGSFTFSSTTEKDFHAAAFLLSKGASLNTISNIIARDISPEQVGILNEMIETAETHKINGIDIAVTKVSTDKFIQDFAFLTHKIVKMENLDTIFALARMKDKIYIVARSRIPEVDVGAILSRMGGGGHAFAAAATVKEKTLFQAENELLSLLSRSVRQKRKARDLMSSPAITIPADITIKEAGQLMTRYNINALLITTKTRDKDIIHGFITRQVAEKALYHQLEQATVDQYMTTEHTFVEPDADFFEIQNKIIEHKQRILPVIEHGKIIGVVTRTDLFNILVRQSQKESAANLDPLKIQVQARTRRIINLMKERLPQNIIILLKSIGDVAQETGVSAYVVGGFVRDLLLYKPNYDIDIVIEGDGISFAREYARMMNAHIHTYKKFGTAVITIPGGFKIDVASARMEYYQHPAALPTVEMSSIKLDLYRRDFTINTLAIRLTPDYFGTLIDFFSAQKDLKDKTIRVIHNLSFVEDPTRVFRAIRFEKRFGFTIGKLTAGLIDNAVKMDFFKRLSGPRVFTELKYILEEDNPVPAILRLFDYELLKVLHPKIKFDKNLVQNLDAAKKTIGWHDLLFLEEPYEKWTVYFMLLIINCSAKTTGEICDHIKLPPRYEKLLGKDRLNAISCLASLENELPMPNSRLFGKLSHFKTESILFMMAITRKEKAKKAISHYYRKLRNVTVMIKGRDLEKMGIPPGPAYKTIMDDILNARLNGRVKTEADELKLARRYLPSP